MTRLGWLVGVGAVLMVSSPAMAGPMTATVAAGGYNSCAVTREGGVACWGDNDVGQLGDGTTTRRLAPTTVSGLSSGVTAVSAGGGHTCALTSGGGVVCWGSNSLGQLGDGTTTDRLTPVAVSGLSNGVTAVSAGSVHTCALTSGGGVVCWGFNSEGRLGDGTRTDRLTPVAVSGLATGVTSVAAGSAHTCAVTSAGGVMCWGYNRFGPLGDGTTTGRLTPVAVSGLSSGVIAVVAGSDHTCAVTSGGGVRCWGNNDFGQLGDGTKTTRLTPVAVSGLSSGVSTVTAGYRHTCAVTSAGGVVCWGSNGPKELGGGQLGDGTTTDRSTPVSVIGLSTGVTAVAAGVYHTCATVNESEVACWGANRSGQLGDGTTTARLTPVTVFNGVTPTMTLDRTSLVFAAVSDGVRFTSRTPSQTVRLTPAVGGTSTWTAASTAPWLVVAPASGSGPAILTISTQFASGLTASQTGQVTLTFSGTGNTAGRIFVTLTTRSSSDPVSRPFGNFDTPAGDATVLSGSVAVTGWTLDNIGVQRVELWRDLQAGETTTPFASTPSDPRNGKVFIASPTFVDGARPDIEGLYPATPVNYKAGWGYLMLTWGLWNQGNGTYKLYAFAFDQENNVATIGSKTIVVNNNAATKPFGSIDTPAVGGDASGPNFGWALTPKVNGAATCKIQPTGVRVSIDSGPLQPVVYGDFRADIASAFPGYSNSAAAGGHYEFDWSTLSNGVHTIGWLVTDDCGRADGIGSRFFNVTTGTNLLAEQTAGATSSMVAQTESQEPITVARGHGELPEIVTGEAGSRTVEIKQGERIEMRLPRGFESASQIVNGQGRALPVGATWDAASGIFSWEQAPGFLGRFRLVFSNGSQRISVRVVVTP